MFLKTGHCGEYYIACVYLIHSFKGESLLEVMSAVGAKRKSKNRQPEAKQILNADQENYVLNQTGHICLLIRELLTDSNVLLTVMHATAKWATLCLSAAWLKLSPSSVLFLSRLYT